MLSCRCRLTEKRNIFSMPVMPTILNVGVRFTQAQLHYSQIVILMIYIFSLSLMSINMMSVVQQQPTTITRMDSFVVM